MLYKEELNRFIRDIEGRKSELRSELKTLPDGLLHVDARNGSEYFTVRYPKKGNRKKERRKGITNDTEMVNGLIRKRYIDKALKIMDADIELLRKAEKKYCPFDEVSVMGSFIDAHPKLKQAVLRNPLLDEQWASNYSMAKDLFEESKTSLAGDGTMMRSRGEIVIAEKLRQYGIPFRYEAEFSIPDIPYTPDFMIRRPRDWKIFYWEHFGDVNDRAYMKRNGRKLEIYEDYGIVPWDNLIITYDTWDGGVNTPLIEAMIHAWLI